MGFLKTALKVIFKFILFKVVPVLIAFVLLYYYVKSNYPYPDYEIVELTLEEKLANVNVSERYQTHVSVDKHIYRPGDRVQFHAVILGVFHHRPLTSRECRDLTATKNTHVTILGPSGSSVFNQTIYWTKQHCNLSTVESSWKIPPDTPGGDYSVKIHFTKGWWRASGERKFQIREHTFTRLTGNIEFRSKAYGPGDSVLAILDVTRTDGEIPEGAEIDFSATINGENIAKGSQEVDAAGKGLLKFELPSFDVVSQAVLTAKVKDAGIVETFSKTIPIAFSQLQIDFLPEAGELVEGVQNVVYFQAAFPNKSPADISGSLCEIKGESCTPITSVRTKHEGRGKFEFYHKLGAKYAVQVHQPSGISKLSYLPITKSSDLPQVSFTVSKPVLQAGDKISATVSSRKAFGGFNGALSRNDKILMRSYSASSVLQFQLPNNFSAGVYTLTLFQYRLPVAERLIFVQPSGKIHFGVKSLGHAGSMTYAPGDKVKLEITSLDESGNPIPAVFSVKVVDKSVARKVDPRLRHPRLGSMALLENEVISFRDSGNYLSEGNEENIELLLGVQGWRKFVYSTNLTEFVDFYGKIAWRNIGSNPEVLTPQFVKKLIPFNKFKNTLISKTLYKNTTKNAKPEEEGRLVHLERAMKKHKERMLWKKKAKKQKKKKPVKKNLYLEQEPDIDEFLDEEWDEDFNEMAEETEESTELFAGLPQITREYAKSQNRQYENRDGQRQNLEEVVLYKSGLRSSALENFKNKIEFTLSDQISTYEILVDGYSATNEPVIFGETTSEIRSVRPFYAEAKVPIEASVGDNIVVPVTLFNARPRNITSRFIIEISEDCELILEEKVHSLVVPPLNSARKLINLKPKKVNLPLEGTLCSVTVSAETGDTRPKLQDTIVRQFRILPKGFPAGQYIGGILDGETSTKAHSFVLPPTTVPGTVVAKLEIIRSQAEQLNSSIYALAREPHGSFEQTSSNLYPLVLAYQRMLNSSESSSSLLAETYSKIERGYKRMLAFESKCESGPCGFELFGQAPGHEAITSYGLMELIDMAKVFPVDPKLIARTKDWLFSKFGHTFLHATDPFILWALSSAGVLEPNSLILDELRVLSEKGEKDNDPYQIGLLANANYNLKQPEKGFKLATKLTKFLDEKDGVVRRAETSFTSSRGDALLIETTSLAILAWTNDAHFKPQAIAAAKWLASQSQNGKFGSTQGTVLALKALLAFEKQNRVPSGDVTISVFGKAVPIVDGHADFSNLCSANGPTPVSIELQSPKQTSVNFEISLEYKVNSLHPDSQKLIPIALKTTLRDSKISEGQSTNVNVQVTNTENSAQGMVVAIIGIPAGLEVRFERLQELVKDKTIDYFEIFGRELILYWRGFEAQKQVEVSIEVTAALQGEYEGPASRAYLFYDDATKSWNNPLRVQIVQ